MNINSKEFIQVYRQYYGENIDNIQQIEVKNLSGFELFDFVKYVVNSIPEPSFIPFIETKDIPDAVIVSGTVDDKEYLAKQLANYGVGSRVLVVGQPPHTIIDKPDATLVLKSIPIQIDPIPGKVKRTNHERQPAGFGKGNRKRNR